MGLRAGKRSERSGRVGFSPLPPNPLELVLRDQQLAARPAHRVHVALPNALRQRDRGDAELGGGVR